MKVHRSIEQGLQSHLSVLRKRRWLTRDIVVRMIADAVMVNAALLIALILRYLWSINNVEPILTPTRAAFGEFMEAYLSTFWILTLIGLIVFYRSGFYTRGRFYAGRYKVLVVFQAVSLTYLIFAVVLLLLREVVAFPRVVLFVAWPLTLAFLIGARLWSELWLALNTVGKKTAPSFSENEIQNILVIGGAGYIGSALVERLLELDYRVGVLDLLVYGDESMARFYENPHFELIRGDFRRTDTVVRAAKGRDAIVHLGAIVGDSACSIHEDLTLEINLGATRTIAEIGKGFGVKRFVFASSCSVYGASDEILDERSLLRPISLYARTKMESEKVLLSLADTSFSPTILRFGTIYGLSGRPRFDLVLNLLTAKAIQDGELGIFGGTQWRPLVHVRDVAEAIVLVLQASLDNVLGQIFNVGCNDQNYQIGELGPIIQEMVPTARVVVQPTEDNRNYRVQFDKIHKMLNFQPRYTIRDGITEIIEAFATHKITDYRDPSFSNFSYLKQSDKLIEILPLGAGDWEWARLTATDAMLLTNVVMAVIESGSEELMRNLREGLVQAILGDVDGFLDTLTGMRLTPQPPARSARAPDPQPMQAAPQLEGTEPGWSSRDPAVSRMAAASARQPADRRPDDSPLAAGP